VNQIILYLTKEIADIPFMTKYRELCSQHPAEPNLKESIEEMFQSIPKSEYELFLTTMYKSIFTKNEKVQEDNPLGEPLSEPLSEEKSIEETKPGMYPDMNERPK
jgi:hypothetical protein